jgi:hypothetical protein
MPVPKARELCEARRDLLSILCQGLSIDCLERTEMLLGRPADVAQQPALLLAHRALIFELKLLRNHRV